MICSFIVHVITEIDGFESVNKYSILFPIRFVYLCDLWSLPKGIGDETGSTVFAAIVSVVFLYSSVPFLS